MEPITVNEVVVRGEKWFAKPELVLVPKLDAEGWLCVEEPLLNLSVCNQTIEGLKGDVANELSFLIGEYVRKNVESFAEDAIALRDRISARFSKQY